MTAWPPVRNGLVETVGALTAANTNGTTLASSFTQLTASTSYAWKGFIVHTYDTAGTKATFDIGIGGAGAEATIAKQLLFGISNGTLHGGMYYVPVAVPKGSRVAALSSSGAVKAVIYGIADNFDGTPGFQLVETVGTSSGAGTSINCGTVVNTKSAYSQLVASTTYSWGGIMLGLSQTTAQSSNGNFLIDIAQGGAGSESIVLSNISANENATNGRWMTPQFISPFCCSIPSGTRISARAQSSSGTNGNILDVAVYGLVS